MGCSYIRLRYEESPRYENAATTTPYRISTDAFDLKVENGQLTANPFHLSRADEANCQDGDPPDLLDGYAPAGSLSLKGYPNSLAPLLGLAGLDATITEGDGSTVEDPDSNVIPANAFLIEFAKRSNSTAQTATINATYQRSETDALYLLGSGYAVNSIGMNYEGQISASLTGLVLERLGSDPGITPSFDSDAITPIRPKRDFSLTWGSGKGNVDEFSWQIETGLEATRDEGNDTYYPSIMEHLARPARMTGSINFSKADVDDYDRMMSAGTFAAQATYVGRSTIGATGFNYKVFVEIPSCQIISGDPPGVSSNVRYPMSQQWKAAHDETAGYDHKISIVCAVDSLATYA